MLRQYRAKLHVYGEGVETRCKMKIISPVRFAKKLILGAVLGDAFLGDRNNSGKAKLILTQGARQFDYMLWKMQALQPLVGDFYVKIRTSSAGRPIVQAVSKKVRDLYHVHKDLYVLDGDRYKKVIRFNVLRRLTPLSLACWFQDDGSLYSGGDRRLKGLRLATYCFSKEEHSVMQQYFLEAWKLHVNVVDRGRSYCYIGMNKENTEKFIELIRPFVHPTMRYKIDTMHHCAEHEYTHEEIVRSLQQCKDLVRNYQTHSKQALTLDWAQYVKGPNASEAMKMRM